MEIDFNHVRKKTGESYNDLVRFLSDKNKDGSIHFEDTEIEEILFDLRSSIGAIMSTSEHGDDGFKNLHNDPALIIFETFEGSFYDESDYHAE